MITEAVINDVYLECLTKAISLIDLKHWKHQPNRLGLDTHKSKYGQATHDGIVLINPAFIGTCALNKLKETVFHELSHLIVGLDKHHNKRFRTVESQLAVGIEVPESEREEVKLNNGYKLRLIAYGENHLYDLGGAFRKTKKYTSYNPSSDGFMRIKGDKLLRFEYVDFDTPNPVGTITKI